MAKGLRYPDGDRQARHDAVDFAGMEAEVREVEAAVARMAPPHAFAHNDLLSGNILVSTLVRMPRDGQNCRSGALVSTGHQDTPYRTTMLCDCHDVHIGAPVIARMALSGQFGELK